MLEQMEQQCTGCSACVDVCPRDAITMESNAEGFLYPRINHLLCSKCGLCEMRCPTLHPISVKKHSVSAFAVINKEDAVRRGSSSGGVFQLLAKQILAEGGVVFGVKFDKEMNAIHSCAETMKDIRLFQGSKYVQSRLGQTYSQVKGFLSQGRKVLFSGTPCQIVGLKAYLNREYEKLYCVDFVCHGVPSPLVWSRYIQEQEKRYGSKIISASFRDKRHGWRNYYVTLKLDNGKEISRHRSKDEMMKAYLADICLRNSCYQCKFKGCERNSDITLADFWGIEKVIPDMDDDMGTTLLLLQTKNGRALFETISKSVFCRELDCEFISQYSPMMVDSTRRNPDRAQFFELVSSDSLLEAVRRYCSESFLHMCRNELSIMLSKIKTRIMRGGGKYV